MYLYHPERNPTFLRDACEQLEPSWVTTTSPASDLFAIRRLNRLAAALQSRSYLEIGVFDGETFLGVDAAACTGVDPDFTSIGLPARVKMASNASAHALRHGHPGTVIVIGDTIPCDVFSTSRDVHDCMNFRRSVTA